MNDDDPFLASLLYEDEGSTLDFKREQYPYVTNEQKGELIKDILAFTNAWRHADAYILIGVAEKPGSYATVIGVTDHLKDAEIQQLVNSKTNQPVTFSYRSARLDGKNIGVLHIPIQDRPRFITKRFGKLAADTVYLRRGSSTAVAQPDEIARMGATHTPQTSPVLQLQFADAKQRRLTGDTQAIHATHFAIDDIEEIPKYEERTPFGPGSLTYWPYRTNPNYLQDRTVYTWAQHLCKPLQFAITNSGPVTAMDVRVELTVQSPHAVLFDEDSWPKEPASREDRFSIAHNLSGFHMKYDDSITVQQLPDYSSVVKICTHKIQPKETKWIESLLYLGARSSGKIILNGTMRADNISTPQPARLTVICTTEQNKTTWREVVKEALQEEHTEE